MPAADSGGGSSHCFGRADTIGYIDAIDRDNRQDPELDETVAGRYRLERLLARGGMGEVFAALDRSTGARIALKRMLVSENNQAKRSPAINFMREYYALTELRHPRIISVFDYGVDRARPYYTMELLDGQDLRELSPVPYREACGYLRDVASSLALLHARRLLHRDISPRNVRRTSDGRCKLLDFGAMVPFGVPPNLTGTPSFIAPEALQGGPLDQRADLYSLGALAYFVLTGRLAYAAGELAALPRVWKEPVVRPSRIVSDVPAALDELVLSLLSVDAMQRPSCAAEVIDRLSAAAELEPENDTAAARSFLSGSQLLGRAPEIERLRKHVSKTASGRGSAVLVCGESGMGKSRMLAEAALIGQTDGLTVVRTVARAGGTIAGLASDLVQGLLQAAPVEAQRASATRPLIAAHSFAADSGDSRAGLLRELVAFVEEVARGRPLLITVDDLDRADEFSGSLIAALAYQGSDCPLSVVASYDTRHEAPMLAQVPGLAETITLTPLERGQTITLAASLFGDVPNLERVGDWLYRVAAGNPKLALHLAEHLLAQGVVRYADGTWVLPSEIAQTLPPSAAATLLLQLQGLSADARALAELLCVSRAGATAECILELSRQPPAELLHALEELVRRGVLESAGNTYVFAQDALRESLLESLAPERRQELHKAWAERLLSGKPSPEAQLEAGWHLVHTAQELRGADILAKIAPGWVERRVNMAVAVPALESALEIYTRHDRPLAQRLYLRSLLVMSSFLFDHRLAARHADPTLDGLYPFTGLPLVERWSKKIGKTAAFGLAVVWTLLRWLVRPHKTRGPLVFDALQYYARASMGLVGLRALAVDVPGVQAAFERMRMFEGLPHPTLQLLFTLSKAISVHLQGRSAEAPELVQSVLARLESRNKVSLQMNEADRTDVLSGALLLEGIDECYRERSKALSYVKRLEQLGTPLAVAAAMRISMSYYMLRGETERTQFYRRLLDLSAIQNGTVWQIDWIAVPIEGVAGMIWSDVVMMRRAVDALSKMAMDQPAFAGMRDTIQVGYQFRRGDFAAVVRDGDEYMRTHPPFSQLGWASAYAQIALSHLELGNPDRALAISESAFSLLDERHLQYPVHHSTLEAAYAVALVVSGQRERGEAMFHAMIDRLRTSGEHTRAFLMHEYRVKVARLIGDRAAVRTALKDMREAALASENPSAILLAHSVSELRARARSSPLPPTTNTIEQPETFSVTRAEETVVTAFLRAEQLFQRRAEHALRILGQYAGSGEAYLFWMKQGALELAASLDRRDVPAALERALAALPANDQYQTLSVPQELGHKYTIVKLDGGDGRVGLAAIRGGLTFSEKTIPDALLSDIGKALADTGQ